MICHLIVDLGTLSYYLSLFWMAFCVLMLLFMFAAWWSTRRKG